MPPNNQLQRTALRAAAEPGHRVGYADSRRLKGPVSIAEQAAHLRSLLGHLGIARRTSSVTHRAGTSLCN